MHTFTVTPDLGPATPDHIPRSTLTRVPDGTPLARVMHRPRRLLPWPRRARWTVLLPTSPTLTGRRGTAYAWYLYVLAFRGIKAVYHHRPEHLDPRVAYALAVLHDRHRTG